MGFSFSKGNNEKSIGLWAYPEWADDPYYYDQLTDGNEAEVNIFKRYKEKMDLEFPNPSINENATIIENDWLLCPFCIDAWQSNSREGMVICPKCNHILHNPHYI